MRRILTLVTLGLFAGCVNQSAHRAVVPTAGAARLASRNPADDVVMRVQEVYRNTPRMTVRFRQKVVNKTFGLPSVSDGTMYLKRPGKMRWDYFSKRSGDGSRVARSLILTGKALWAVSGNPKWRYGQNPSKSSLPVAVVFLGGTNALSREFNARLLIGSKHGATGDKVIELRPKKRSGQFETLVLVVDPSDYHVKKSIVTSASGDTNEFSFYEPDTSKVVADSWFLVAP
jgi:outer membrane lipoprotein carrier protein